MIARSIGGSNASKNFNIADVNSWQLISFSAEPSDYNAEGFDQFIIRISGNVSIDIYAAKLELGDTQTLAHQENGKWVLNDPPPNPSLELAKCQRYQIFGPMIAQHIRSNNSKTMHRLFLNTPVTLRAKPTIIGTPLVKKVGNNADSSGAVVSVYGVESNGIALSVENTTDPCYADFIDGTGLDANL